MENYVSIIRTKVFVCVSPQMTGVEPGLNVTTMDGLLLESWGPFVIVDAWVSSNYFVLHFENTNVLINLCSHTVLETGDGPGLYETCTR